MKGINTKVLREPMKEIIYSGDPIACINKEQAREMEHIANLIDNIPKSDDPAKWPEMKLQEALASAHRYFCPPGMWGPAPDGINWLFCHLAARLSELEGKERGRAPRI